GETVSVGGGCACQVKAEVPTFLMVNVAVVPWSAQVSVNFRAGPVVAVVPGVEAGAGEPVADAVAVPDRACAVSDAEGEDVEREGVRSGACGLCESPSTAIVA